MFKLKNRVKFCKMNNKSIVYRIISILFMLSKVCIIKIFIYFFVMHIATILRNIVYKITMSNLMEKLVYYYVKTSCKCNITLLLFCNIFMIRSILKYCFSAKPYWYYVKYMSKYNQLAYMFTHRIQESTYSIYRYTLYDHE